jgi:D-alanyl-D-alanine carboxypeptidase/D-alanyl-D-alanine-endopeptidase (penicillin-binding protein 4)
MSRLYCFRAAAFLLILFVPARSLSAADDLAERLDSVMNGPHYQQARWGVLVVDAETGKTVYAHDADRLFIPASTTKLYSCAAALAALGADHKFETPVYRRGDVMDGRLKGDLILVASGDLTLGGRTDSDGKLAFQNDDHIYANSFIGKAKLTDTDPLAGLKELAKQIAAAGVKRIDGEVLIDDRLFERSHGSGSGPDHLTPIVVNDNVVDVLVTPAEKAGEPAKVVLRPETSFVQMDAQVTTVPEGKENHVEIHGVGGERFLVRGRVAVKSPPVVRIFPVDDPAGFARALFIEVLRKEGVSVPASPLRAPQAELPEQASYVRMPRVALYTSPPLSELLKVTLKVSHNLYASTLPLLVAVSKGKRTLEDGLKVQRRILSDLGVETATISFGGGAGGANADSVTPRATVQLLRAMSKRPDYEVYRAGLPVLGVDGTLHDTVGADSPARGKVLAKTGTLGWHDVMNDRLLLRSKALAGTMTTQKGRTLFFAIFVNDVPLPRDGEATREGKVLGKLCEILYQHAP